MVKTLFSCLLAITLVWTSVSTEPFPPGNGSHHDVDFNWSLDPEFDLIHSNHVGPSGTPHIPIFRVGSGAGMFADSEWGSNTLHQSDWSMSNWTWFSSPDIVWDPATGWSQSHDSLPRNLQEHSPFLRFGRTINAVKIPEHSSSSFTLPQYTHYIDTTNIRPSIPSPKFLEPRPQAEGLSLIHI